MAIAVESFGIILILLGGCFVQTRSQNNNNGDLCLENIPVYNNVTCTSCNGICGQMLKLKKYHCSCDSACLVYNDCCPDFQTACPAHYSNATEINKKYGNLQHTCQQYLKGIPETSFITSCPKNESACTDHDSAFDVIPVTDLETGLEFVNTKCAVCNGVKNGRIWNATMYCNTNTTIPSNVANQYNNSAAVSTQSVLNVLGGDCFLNIDYQLPAVHPLRECVAIFLNPCETCKNEYLKTACEHGPIQLTNLEQESVRNVYCVMCEMGWNFESYMCGPGIEPPREWEYYTPYSLSLLFDFNPDGRMILRSDPESCAVGTEWISETVGCKLIECGQDYILYQGTCELEWSQLKFTLSVSVWFVNMINASDNSFANYLIPKLHNFILEPGINMTDMTKDVQITPYTYVNESKYDITFHIVFKLKTFQKESTQVLNETKAVIQATVQGAYVYSKIWFEEISGVKLFEVSAENDSTSLSYSMLTCPQILLNEDQYMLLPNGSILLIQSNKVLGENSYIKNGSNIYICKSHLEINSTAPVTGILTVVLLSLSEICILIRLILQPIVPAYNTFPLTLQFHMCLVMFIAFGLFLVSSLLRNWYVACKITAILLHWTFLSLFCWMSIISIDTWKSFKGFNLQRKSLQPGCKNIFKYVLLGWGIPLLCIIVAIILDETKHGSIFQPKYGQENCWMNQPSAILLFFAVPICLAILWNIILFTLTALNLRKAFHDRNKLINSEKERHFSLYVKLFVLMGLTWIFGFIAPFVNHISMWIIFIALNASQGVFIFVSFVCTKQVYEYMVRIRQQRQQSGGDSSGSLTNKTVTKQTHMTKQSTSQFTNLQNINTCSSNELQRALKHQM